jgi:hypothetical protein
MILMEKSLFVSLAHIRILASIPCRTIVRHDSDNLSGLLIARGLNPSINSGYAALSAPFSTELGLAPRKDLAVSLPPFYPYSGIRPPSLGLGLSGAFGSERHCSHLYACAWRLLAATFPGLRREGVRTFLSDFTSELSPRLPVFPY